MRRAIALCALVMIPGCSSSTAMDTASAAVTVRVVNTTCGGGGCMALRVLAFPDNQPHTPGGFWSLDLGVITSESGCVTLPQTAAFTVTDAGAGKTTTYSWTTNDPVSLGTIPSTASRIQASPSTNQFIPMSASGWSVALPSSTTVSPGSACT